MWDWTKMVDLHGFGAGIYSLEMEENLVLGHVILPMYFNQKGQRCCLVVMVFTFHKLVCLQACLFSAAMFSCCISLWDPTIKMYYA